MDQHQREWNEKVAAKIIKNLEKRRMTGSYSLDAAQARAEIVDMIPQGATVFRCGSMTAVGMGLWEAIAALPEVKLIDPYLSELSPEEGLELRRQGLTADVMIASTNAITLDGRLVNLDGMGNRVAAVAFNRTPHIANTLRRSAVRTQAGLDTRVFEPVANIVDRCGIMFDP